MSLGNLHGDGFDGLGCVSQIGWRGKHWREKERWHTVNLLLLVNHDFLFARFLLGLLFTAGNGLL